MVYTRHFCTAGVLAHYDTCPTHFLRRNSLLCQANGSSSVEPSRLACVATDFKQSMPVAAHPEHIVGIENTHHSWRYQRSQSETLFGRRTAARGAHDHNCVPGHDFLDSSVQPPCRHCAKHTAYEAQINTQDQNTTQHTQLEQEKPRISEAVWSRP